MCKYLKPLSCVVFAMLLGASAGYADDQKPSLDETQQWLKDHEGDFTSTFTFSNSSQNVYDMSIQRVEIVLKKYHAKDTPFPGCMIHFYGNIHIEGLDTDSDGGLVTTFRAEGVSDVIEIRKFDRKDLGPEAQHFDAQDCYCLIITQKDPNSDAIDMSNLGVPFLQRQELHYITIPIANYAMAERLAKALRHGIQLIQAQTAAEAKPEVF
jgi:hypothetical protein